MVLLVSTLTIFREVIFLISSLALLIMPIITYDSLRYANSFTAMDLIHQAISIRTYRVVYDYFGGWQ